MKVLVVGLIMMMKAYHYQKVDYVEGVAILVAAAIVVLVGAANDYQKERQFAKLNAKKKIVK